MALAGCDLFVTSDDELLKRSAEGSIGLNVQAARKIRYRVKQLKLIFGDLVVKEIVRKIAWPVAAIFLLQLLSPNSANAGPQGSAKQIPTLSAILEPKSGALLGQYYGAGSIAQTAAKLGRIPPVHLTYYAWDADWNGDVTKADLAAGRIPLVNWEPHKIDFARIVDGSLDATIVARAQGAKALGQKFFLDFAAEMNGDEAWGGNNAQAVRCRVSAYSLICSLPRVRPT